jgi:DNA-binding MarR family transcriptional regulator
MKSLSGRSPRRREVVPARLSDELYRASHGDATRELRRAFDAACFCYSGVDMNFTAATGNPVTDARSDDPLRVWFRFIRLNRRVTAAMATELRGLGLSIPQFDVLSTLTEREGLTQQDLAARLYVTKGNVSGLIDRLVQAGFVERHAIPGDRRSHALHLTPAGTEIAARGISAQKAYVARTLGTLPPDDIAAFEQLVLKWRDVARADSSG